jgi:hypothetical protein
MFAPAAHATTAVYHSDTALIDESALVVTGRCVELETLWVDRDLVTLARVQVDEVLKGTAGAEITVVLPGGIDHNRPVPVAVTYPAAPGIAAGEAVLLFLVEEDRVDDGWSVVGFSQGKFTLTDSNQGVVATQNASGLNLRHADGKITPAAGRTLRVDAVRQGVRQRAAVRRGGENRRTPTSTPRTPASPGGFAVPSQASCS